MRIKRYYIWLMGLAMLISALGLHSTLALYLGIPLLIFLNIRDARANR